MEYFIAMVQSKMISYTQNTMKQEREKKKENTSVINIIQVKRKSITYSSGFLVSPLHTNQNEERRQELVLDTTPCGAAVRGDDVGRVLNINERMGRTAILQGQFFFNSQQNGEKRKRKKIDVNERQGFSQR